MTRAIEIDPGAHYKINEVAETYGLGIEEARDALKRYDVSPVTIGDEEVFPGQDVDAAMKLYSEERGQVGAENTPNAGAGDEEHQRRTYSSSEVRQMFGLSERTDVGYFLKSHDIGSVGQQDRQKTYPAEEVDAFRATYSPRYSP
jgi:hypothetical protein